MARTHTWANVAPAIKTLRAQFDTLWPNRDKSSDGIWPSPAHTIANPTSDHESGNAVDFDNDLARGVEITKALAAQISRDPRCKYVIHEGRIFKRGVSAPYTGSNPHTGHMHVSVYEALRGNTAKWNLGGDSVAAKNKVIVAFVRPEKEAEIVAALAALGVRAYSADADAARVTRKNPAGEAQ